MTDARWARIEPLLPDRAPKAGARWRDHRQVVDAIAFQWRGLGGADSKHPAGVSTSGFPRAASRTRRACLRAPGSPQIPLWGVQFLMP
ncbi:transposase [Streptomyces sp. NPDC092307]|uniref:transposase n=1 Tax=Streptomyces sp. NPDC092307 TaxID=3366013 RepID=UPI0037F69892